MGDDLTMNPIFPGLAQNEICSTGVGFVWHPSRPGRGFPMCLGSNLPHLQEWQEQKQGELSCPLQPQGALECEFQDKIEHTSN